MSQPVIELSKVSFKYGGQVTLDDVALTINEGDFTALIGPNGGGKTTLLKIILGLLQPYRGEVHVMGKTPGEASSCIGYVPQNVHLNTSFPVTVLDVVLMGRIHPGRLFRRNSEKDRHEALQALEKMEIADLADHRIGKLSGGQRQRVFISRALVTDPRLLLLDEPTASIDARGQEDFFRLLSQLNETITILVVSHDFYSITPYLKSVACVNRRLHYHMQTPGPDDALDLAFRCTVEDACPVEMLRKKYKGLPIHDHDSRSTSI